MVRALCRVKPRRARRNSTAVLAVCTSASRGIREKAFDVRIGSGEEMRSDNITHFLSKASDFQENAGTQTRIRLPLMPGFEDTSPEAARVEQMVMHWLTTPFGRGKHARYAATNGYAIYALPVRWLRVAVNKTLKNAATKNAAEWANDAWKSGLDGTDKEVICGNVADAIANMHLDPEGNETLPRGEAERLACEMVYGPDLGTRRSVIRAAYGNPPGWCAQIDMKDAQQHTLLTREDCLL